MNEKNMWTSRVEDAGDGSGDVIIPLPDALMEEMGWGEGTVLEVVVADGGAIALRAADQF